MTDKLTAAQAAALINRSRDEVLRLARAGKLPSTRELGPRGVLEYRFELADVRAYQPASRGQPRKE